MTTPGPLTTDDRLAVTELLYRYARALDSRDMETYIASFAPDAVFQSLRSRAEGLEAIRTMVQSLFDNATAVYRHIPAAPIIEGGNAERCTVRSYAQQLRRDADGSTHIHQVVDYRDTCVKIDGHWVIQERINSVAFGV